MSVSSFCSSISDLSIIEERDVQKEVILSSWLTWERYNGEIFHGSNRLPAPLLDKCWNIFADYIVFTKRNGQPYMETEYIHDALLELNLDFTKEEFENLMQRRDGELMTPFDEFCKMIRIIRRKYLRIAFWNLDYL